MKRTATLAAAYIATIVAANWAVTTYGAIPVGLGLLAPAGVLFAGLAFTLRDLLQKASSAAVCVVAILIGTAVSVAIAGPGLALAAGAAFLVSELADLAVYTPLAERRWLTALTVSNIVGLVVDSVLFLTLAFGSLAFLPGQILGKLYMTAIFVIPVAIARARRRTVVA